MSIIYLDTSAFIKLYIQEKRSDDVSLFFKISDGAGTSILTYTEMASAMAQVVRMRIISENEAKTAWANFLHDWPEFIRLKCHAQLTERAGSLAWEFGLRGYDAMHLASALTWQETLETPVCLATFDRLLWNAGKKAGLAVWPEILIT